MRNFSIIFCFFSSLCSTAQPAVDLKKALDQIVNLDFRVDFTKIKGFTVGVIDADSTYVFNYGVACEGNPEPPTGHTLYELGGTTQVFTALLAQHLQDVGAIVLDSSVNSYLPDSLRSTYGQAITLRDLLQHTSGLPRRPYDFGIYETALNNPYQDYRVSDLITFWEGMGKIKHTGSYLFSLTGYGLLQYILERKTGKSYHTLLTEFVLKPLDMNETQTRQTDQLTCGYSSSGLPMKGWTFMSFEASEGVKSNMTDLLKLAKLQLRPDRYGQLGTAAKALTSTLVPCKKPKNADVGLGWHQISVKRGTKILAITGSTSGHSTFVGLNPATGTGIVILVNSEVGIANMGMQMLAMINQNWKRKS